MDFKKALVRNISWSAAVLILMIAFLIFLGMDVSDRVALIKSQRQDLLLRLHAFDSLAALRSDVGRAEELSISLENSLPARDQLINFSNALEEIATDNGLEFGFSFESESASTETTPGINNFTITSQGTYANFVRFLNEVEDSRYFVGFSLIDLTSRNGEFAITMKGRVFSR